MVREYLLAVALLLICIPGCRSTPPATDSAPDAQSTKDTGTEQLPTAAADESASGSTRRVFAANYGGDTISVIEGDVEVEVQTLDGFDSPQAFAVRPVRPVYIAVANGTSFTIDFLDPDTLKVRAKVDTGEPANDVAFSPDGKTLYAVHRVPGRIVFIDVESFAVTGDPVQFEPREPRRIAVDPDGSRIFVQLVASTFKSEVAIIDSRTRKVSETRIPVDIAPSAFALGNKGRHLVSASFDHSTLSVIDTKALKVVATHPAETGFGLAIHPLKPLAYTMASFDDEFHSVDLETGETTKTFSVGQGPAGGRFTSDGRYIYIANEDSDSVVKVDTETNEVVAKIVVGKEPVAVAVYEP